MKLKPETPSVMKCGNYLPDRGDLIWLDFTPQVGHEQRGRRPALVLSPAQYNTKSSLILCLPITSRIKGYPFEVLLPEGLCVAGAILSDQVRNLDFVARDAELICKAPRKVVESVMENVGALVG